MKTILNANTVEQASAEKVEKWFNGALNFALQDLSERIDGVLSAVKYTKIRGDPAGSALTFCVDVMKALSTNVASDVLDDVDQAAKFIDRLVEKLGSSCKVLRERMKMRREGWTKTERGNFNKFETALSSLAIDVHQNEVVFKRSSKCASNEPKTVKKPNGSTQNSRIGMKMKLGAVRSQRSASWIHQSGLKSVWIRSAIRYICCETVHILHLNWRKILSRNDGKKRTGEGKNQRSNVLLSRWRFLMMWSLLNTRKTMEGSAFSLTT